MKSNYSKKKAKFLFAFVLIVYALNANDNGLMNSKPIKSDTVFTDYAEKNLPQKNRPGFSMDAYAIDIDEDGDLDIMIASEYRPNVLLLNDGKGNFSDASKERIPQVAHDSEDVGIADFDSDGDLDILIVSEDDKVNELYINKGKGYFLDESKRIPVTGTSNVVCVSDFNGDKYPDILIGNKGQNVILINDGKANFVDETTSRLPEKNDVTQDIELGDIDGDNDLDLLIANEDNNRILINDGKGRFTDESEERLPIRELPEETRDANFCDVDNDGDLDVFFANTELFVRGVSRQNRLLINDGNGVFSDKTAANLPEDIDLTMDGCFTDIDNDGDADLITANFDQGDFNGIRNSAPYRVYENDGKGIFKEVTAKYFPKGTTGNGMDIEVGDFNGDGLLDLYLSSRGGLDRLLIKSY